jgi:epoxide hydrolase-like predicted phosphatase
VFSSKTAKLAEVGSISAYQHWQVVARTLQVSDETIPAIRQQFFAGDRIDKDLLTYIQLRRINYRTALLSNAFDDLRRELSGAWRIPDVFDEIVISAEVRIAKPDQRIFHIAAERLHVSADDCIFVDDYPPNVESARLAGMNGVRFMNPEQARHDVDEILKRNQ